MKSETGIALPETVGPLGITADKSRCLTLPLAVAGLLAVGLGIAGHSQSSAQPAPQTQMSQSTPQVAQHPLQITLAWKGAEDLDLSVECPGGRIDFSSRRNCGGEMDIDAGYSDQRGTVKDAQESIVWQKPPPGRYAVTVKLYSRQGQKPRAVPFEVRIRRNGKTETYSGSLTKDGDASTVHAFAMP